MLHVKTIEAPSYWASALINGDYSGLNADECAALNAWRKRELPADASICGCADESRFSWCYDLYGGTAQGGDVLEYQYLTKSE